MAFSIEILGIRWERGQYALERVTGDGGGWRGARELIRDPRFRDLSSQAGYLDYVAALSVNEALALARVVAPDGCSALEASLTGAAFVLVHIFEWESGL
jgi:hypothetical protein